LEVNGQLEVMRRNNGGYFHGVDNLKARVGSAPDRLENGRWRRVAAAVASALAQLEAMFGVSLRIAGLNRRELGDSAFTLPRTASLSRARRAGAPAPPETGQTTRRLDHRTRDARFAWCSTAASATIRSGHAFQGSTSLRRRPPIIVMAP
jgi:hypothetical protein